MQFSGHPLRLFWFPGPLDRRSTGAAYGLHFLTAAFTRVRRRRDTLGQIRSRFPSFSPELQTEANTSNSGFSSGNHRLNVLDTNGQ